VSSQDPGAGSQQPGSSGPPLGDWDRYGLSRNRTRATTEPRNALRPATSTSRDTPEDQFSEYRRENRLPSADRGRRRRSVRFTANVMGSAVVGVAAVVFLVAAMVSGGITPTPTPLISLPPAPTVKPTTTEVPLRNATVALQVDLPVAVAVPDRSLTVDDGVNLYLIGSTSGVALNAATGQVENVLGGEAFASGVNRALVAGGNLWVSRWPTTSTGCGPDCWAQAFTYRVDGATGKVLKAYPATYLIGSDTTSVWIATGGTVEQLEPTTGNVMAVTQWPGPEEPRIGCNQLWSVDFSSQQVTLSVMDVPGSGTVRAATVLADNQTYGPVEAAGECWMTSGSNGISKDSTTLLWINTSDASIAVIKQYGRSVLFLDGEFWTYASDGSVQRLEPVSGTPYGVSYKLPVLPPANDPSWLFAAAGGLWVLDGRTLAGFDVPTGSSHLYG
jgi:hypothetical protein